MSQGKNFSGVSQAERFELFFCRHCPNGHLVFFDAVNKPIVSAVITAKQADSIAGAIRNNDPNWKE